VRLKLVIMFVPTMSWIVVHEETAVKTPVQLFRSAVKALGLVRKRMSPGVRMISCVLPLKSSIKMGRSSTTPRPNGTDPANET
jgi:hypothetical protein